MQLSGGFRRRFAVGTVALRNFAAKGQNFAALRNSPSAWSDQIPMAVTSSFELGIVHRLKHWILDFLSFEMVYSMHELDFGKCSKSGQEDCNFCPLFCFTLFFLFASLLAFRICLWQRTLKLRFFMFLSFPKALPWIPKNSPQPWIALVIKILTKTPKLAHFD